ncbi:MAG: DNA repair protein RadA, partial [Chloroflexota bacterium]|nr:DNA repair protein RadA [Chloroflexota bacterium]
ERLGATRLLRAAKNRFGSTDEVGVLEMRGSGLVEVPDASRFFLERDQPPAPGSAVTVAVEGSRPLAVEIQALVAPAGYGSPRRAVNGIDQNRVLMLIAVLARHAGLNLTGHDVYVNVAGGLRIDEPAVDLAAAAALASSLRAVPVAPATALVGELSLSGRVRAAGRLEARVAEAGRLGFGRIISGPADASRGDAHRRMTGPGGRPQVVTVADVRSALDTALATG